MDSIDRILRNRVWETGSNYFSMTSEIKITKKDRWVLRKKGPEGFFLGDKETRNVRNVWCLQLGGQKNVENPRPAIGRKLLEPSDL